MAVTIQSDPLQSKGNILVDGVPSFSFSSTGLSATNVVGSVSNTSVLATGTLSARSLQDRFADVINVKDFGAKGDGVTDDTAAIQAAINSISLSGGMIFIPVGIYMTTGITVTSNIQILGELNNTTCLKMISGTNAPVIKCHGTQTNYLTNISIKNISIDGNTLPQYITAPGSNLKHGIDIAYASNILLDNLLIYGCAHDGIKGAGIDNVLLQNSKLFKNWIGAYWSGYYISPVNVIESLYISVINCSIYNNANDGIDFDFGVLYSTISNSYVYDNDNDDDGDGGGIVVASDISSYPCKYIGIYNNKLYGGSLSFAGVQNFECIGNFIYNAGKNTTPGQVVWGHGIEVFSKTVPLGSQAVCFGGRIIGNTVIDSGKHGIAVIDWTNTLTAYNITISDNEITNSGTDQNNTYSGIFLTRCTQVNVSNNIVTTGIINRTKHQIEVTNTATEILISDNIIDGASTSNYSLNGSVVTTDNFNDNFNIQTTINDKGLTITGNSRPRLLIYPNDTGTIGRFYSKEQSWYASGLLNNIQWNGSWNLDNTTKTGWDISTDTDLDYFQIRRADIGSNPRTLDTLMRITTAGVNQTSAWLLVNNGTTTTLRQVTIGAADSGGTGFRTLRVPN